MNKFFLILFLSTNFFYSQSFSIKVRSIKDNLPIKDVIVYGEKDYFGMTDENGQIIINSETHVLKFVKEGFYDSEFNIEKTNERTLLIELEPISIIQLEPILLIASKEDPNSILNKIQKSRFEQNHRNGQYYQSKVEFKKGDDVLYYFNNLLHLSNDLKVNDNNTIIYHGKRLKNCFNQLFELFEIDKQEIRIPVQSTIYCSLGQHELTPIFEGKLYSYVLEKSDTFYVLRFSPKKKNSTLLHQGYFVIDKFDFGIIELQVELAESNNNQWFTFDDNKKKYGYQVQQDEFSFKFSKFEDKYFLENSSRIMKCVQTEGNHIDSVFDFRIYNEETLIHNGLEFKPFDFTLNNFKP